MAIVEQVSDVAPESHVILNLMCFFHLGKGIPDTPRNISVVCEIRQAKVQWISSFNGGDPQYFLLLML